MYKGQAFGTKVHEVPRAKISDGKSVAVTVPASKTIAPAEFVLLDGWFGFTFEGVKTKAGETAVIALNIEQAEYETDQLADGEYKVGTEVYFDKEAKKITADEGTDNPKVGKVTKGKNEQGAICFILAAQA